MDLKDWYLGGCFRNVCVERLLGLPKGTIGHWLSGRRSLRAEHLRKLEVWAVGYGYRVYVGTEDGQIEDDGQVPRVGVITPKQNLHINPDAFKEDKDLVFRTEGKEVFRVEVDEGEVWDYTNVYWRQENDFEDRDVELGLWKWGELEGGVVMNIEGVIMWKEGIGVGSVVDLGSMKVKLGLRNVISLI